MTILRLKSEIAALKVMLAFRDLEILMLKANFNPNQPRDPEGSPTGGQWSGGGSGGGSTRRPAGGGSSRTQSNPKPQSIPAAPAKTPGASLLSRPSDRVGGQTETWRDTTGREPWKEVTTTFDEMGGIAEQAISNRDGSTIRSEFSFADSRRAFDEAHTVTMGQGTRPIRFEQSGDTLSIYTGSSLLKSSEWTPDGPADLAEPANALAVEAARQVATLVAASAIVLYNWYNNRPKSADDSDGSVPLLAFRARAYAGSNKGTLSYVGERSREDVDRACPRHQEVLDRTAAAVMAIKEELRGTPYRPQDFGTKVHKHLENQINALRDPDFIAERSIGEFGDASYGDPGTIRTDVFEKTPSGLVCVYDIKTGRAGLSLARSNAIAARVITLFGVNTQFLIIESRPPTP